MVLEVRRFRSEQGVKPSQRIPARFSGLEGFEAEIRSLLRLTEPAQGFSPTASLTTAGGVRIELDLSTAIDVAAERARLGRDQAAAQKELDQTAGKLANEKFLANAKPEVVSSIRERNARAAAELERIGAALAALPRPMSHPARRRAGRRAAPAAGRGCAAGPLGRGQDRRRPGERHRPAAGPARCSRSAATGRST